MYFCLGWSEPDFEKVFRLPAVPELEVGVDVYNSFPEAEGQELPPPSQLIGSSSFKLKDLLLLPLSDDSLRAPLCHRNRLYNADLAVAGSFDYYFLSCLVNSSSNQLH